MDLLGGKGDGMKTFMASIGATTASNKGGAANAKTPEMGRLAQRMKGMMNVKDST